MTNTNQKQLGNTLWSIADQLRGAMDADDFRDYMLSFLFLRYLPDNYETAAKKELGKDFIFQYFKNHGLKSVVSGSAQPQITRAGFAPLVIFFPEPDEQERIATCLSSLDALITAETQKHEALKTHKKGLMQQLFPLPEEVEA
jgi:type I restriction-modification system DNA methylase subunit